MPSDITQQAMDYLKTHKADFLAEFTKAYQESNPQKPLSLFLAGSPGAGKTEYAQSLITLDLPLLHINTDAVRAWLPMYTGSNSDLLQQASSRGVDFLFAHALKENMSLLLDSTFTPYTIALQNIERSLKRKRRVQIHYIYQDPLVAWQFVQKRELVEGRFVPKEAFIQKFFEAYDNIRTIKKKFGDSIELTVVVKDYQSDEKQFYLFVSSLENIIHIPYTQHELRSLLS